MLVKGAAGMAGARGVARVACLAASLRALRGDIVLFFSFFGDCGFVFGLTRTQALAEVG
jgi:hypothetical protein